MKLIRISYDAFSTIFLQGVESLFTDKAIKNENRCYFDIATNTGVIYWASKDEPMHYEIILFPEHKIQYGDQHTLLKIGKYETIVPFHLDEFKDLLAKLEARVNTLKQIISHYKKTFSSSKEALNTVSEKSTPYKVNIFSPHHEYVVFSSTDKNLFENMLLQIKEDELISDTLHKEITKILSEEMIPQNNEPLDEYQLMNELLKEPNKNELFIKKILYSILHKQLNTRSNMSLLDFLKNHQLMRKDLFSTIGIVYFLKYLARFSEDLSTLVNEIIFYTDKNKDLIELMNQLTSIEIKDGGASHDNWSHVSSQLLESNLPIYSKEQKTHPNLLSDWNKNISLTTIDLKNDILKKGWLFLRFQGRTILFKKNKDDTLLALKIKKDNEDILELHKENNTVIYLNTNKKSLGLQSKLPTPKGVAKISGLAKWLKQIHGKGVINDEELNNFNASIADITDTADAYLYEAKPSYFKYLHDPSLSDKEFFSAARIAINDLLQLMQKGGIVYDRLADLFHNVQEDAMNRLDAGRYMSLVFLMRNTHSGGGRLNAWEKAVEFPNIGQDGLRDLGDWNPIGKFTNASEKLARKFFSETHSKYPDTNKASFLIEANFVAEYFLVMELLAGKRVCNQLRQQPLLSQQDKDKLWLNTVSQLTEIYIAGFTQISGLPKDVIRRFLNSIYDTQVYARQMQYWMTPKTYIPDIKANQVGINIYSNDTKVNVDFSHIRSGTFNEQVGCSIDGKNPDLGTVNGPYPIKIGECVRDNIAIKGPSARKSIIENSRALCKQGTDYFLNNQLEKACDYYKQAIKANPYAHIPRRLLIQASEQLIKQTDDLALKQQLQAALAENKKQNAFAYGQRLWRIKKEKQKTRSNDSSNLSIKKSKE